MTEIVFSKAFICFYIVISVVAVLWLGPLVAVALAILLTLILKKFKMTRRCVTRPMGYKILLLSLPTVYFVSSFLTVLGHIWSNVVSNRFESDFMRVTRAYEQLADEDGELRIWKEAYENVSSPQFTTIFYSILSALVAGKLTNMAGKKKFLHG